MKTSNKILLGIFLTIILLTTAVQLMVYAKYKRGEYVKFKQERFSQMTAVEIPAVRFISIEGLGNCSVLPGDKPRLEVKIEKVGRVIYRVVNDTLFLIGDTAITIDELERGTRNYSYVNLYLPATVQVKAVYSNLGINGAADSSNMPSYTIRLEKNSYFFINKRNPHDKKISTQGHENGDDKPTAYLNQLNISSEQSKIELDGHSFINDLNVQLINSNIDDKEAVIKKLTMDADSKSTVTLSGNNIKALK
jgi:hypothetical protein